MDITARAAFLNAQAACMGAEIAAMQEQNRLDARVDRTPTYKPDDFMGLCVKYGLDHNAALTFLRDY